MKQSFADIFNKQNEANEYMSNCYNEIHKKQAVLLKKYKISTYDSFGFKTEGDKMFLNFSSKNRNLKCEVIPIGSWASSNMSFMWSWSNKTIAKGLRDKAEALKELRNITGYDYFDVAGIENCDQVKAHELVAVAVDHLNALGMYIAPITPHLKMFLAIKEIVFFEEKSKVIVKEPEIEEELEKE